MFSTRLWQIVLFSTALTLSSCTQTPSNPTQTTQSETTPTVPLPNVVATSNLLCDLTKQIAGDTIRLTCLMDPGQDPHVYEPTPSDRQAIEAADLVLYGGYEYESDLIKIIEATTSPAPKIAVYEAAVPDPLMGEAHEHDHGHAEEHAESEHSEEEESGHGEEAMEPDPHIWHDAANGSQIVTVIREELVAIVPDQEDQYTQKAETLMAELEAIDRWIKTQVATVPEAARKLVTTHASFNYFANAYGFTVKGALSGLSTDEAPSAAQLAELVDLVKESDVPAIFAESTTNPKLIETVAREANVQVAETPLFIEGPGGLETEAPTYQRMLVTNTCTVVNALGGQCSPEQIPLSP